ncbi:MucBP domain-containing protein [Fusibacter bizertensis]
MKTNLKKLSTLFMIFALILFSVPFSSYAADSENPANATIYITADDAYNLYVNGVPVGSDNNWRQKESYRVTLYNNYLIAVEAWDEHQVIDGFNMQIVFDDPTIPTVETKTASAWLVTTTPEANWQLPSTTISGWSPVTEIQDSRWSEVGGQWVWTPNYVFGNELFDARAYFRFDGVNPNSSLTLSSTIYELTSPTYTGDDSITNNGNAGYVNFQWLTESIDLSNESHDAIIAHDTVVKMTAISNEGYEFVGWKPSLDAPASPSLSNPYNVTVTSLTNAISAVPVFRLIPEETSSNETQATSETQTPTQPTTQAPTEPQGPQGSVVVNFVDTEGASLASSYNFTGSVGTLYQTSARTIDGYELVETPANASGSFIDGSVTVDYVYASGVTVVEEDTPLGEAITPVNFDSIYDSMEITTEAASDEHIILDEETPLADALPQTGQATPELFYGVGGMISAIGIYLKKRK